MDDVEQKRKNIMNEQHTVNYSPDSIQTQYVLAAIGLWVGLSLSAIDAFLPELISLLITIVQLPALIVSIVFSSILLYRQWNLLQGHSARTTPGKAVGFSFIPLFAFYWWFVAYVGLVKDSNRYMDDNGIDGSRMSYGVAVSVCVLGIAMGTIGMFPVIGSLLAIPGAILSFIYLDQRKSSILAILRHRASAQQTTEPCGGSACATPPPVS